MTGPVSERITTRLMEFGLTTAAQGGNTRREIFREGWESFREDQEARTASPRVLQRSVLR
jgi:hypothetical protein